MRHVGAAMRHRGDDRARIARLDAMARAHGRVILATNDVLYHAPDRRPLQDVMTCIRHGTTIAEAGHLLEANGERHLKSPAEMCRLFADWPHATAASLEIAAACTFSLAELRYDYPNETIPETETPWPPSSVSRGRGRAGATPPACRAACARRSAPSSP